MAKEKRPERKTRTRTFAESFVKGVVKTTAKHFGPDSAAKMVETIQKLGAATNKKEPAVEELPEPEVSKEALDELEQLIKDSEANAVNPEPSSKEPV